MGPNGLIALVFSASVQESHQGGKARALDTSLHQPTSAGSSLPLWGSTLPLVPRESVTPRRRRQTMMPSGQLLPLTRPPPPPPAPPVLSSRRSRRLPPARAHARGSPPPLWRAHRLHDRFLHPPPQFRAPARAPRPPTPPGVSTAGGGEAQAAAVAEFVTSERVKVAAMLGLALALCNADRVVMSVAIVPLSQAYGWTPSFAGVVQVPGFRLF